MAEKVTVRQNQRFETVILAVDPHDEQAQEFFEVQDVRELTPYGMLLASLGGCTAIVIHTYAQNHGVKLEEVELRLTYERVFVEDCEHCEEIEKYEERIEEEIELRGDLSERDRQRLYVVSGYCPIHKMMQEGVEIHSALSEG